MVFWMRAGTLTPSRLDLNVLTMVKQHSLLMFASTWCFRCVLELSHLDLNVLTMGKQHSLLMFASTWCFGCVPELSRLDLNVLTMGKQPSASAYVCKHMVFWMRAGALTP